MDDVQRLLQESAEAALEINKGRPIRCMCGCGCGVIYLDFLTWARHRHPSARGRRG